MVNWLKQISAPATTTENIFAGDVLNWVIQYHDDVDLAAGDPNGIVTILTETVFNSGSLKFFDSNKSHKIAFTFPDYSENKTVSLPSTLPATDDVLTRTAVQTVTGKAMDGDDNAFSDIPNSALKQITDKAKLHSSILYGDTAFTMAKQGSTPGDPATEDTIVYVRAIDANNNGVFIKTKKNGAIVEVQIA